MGDVWVSARIGAPPPPPPGTRTHRLTDDHTCLDSNQFAGELLDWRWEDSEHTRWRALVRFSRGPGRVYEQWVDGSLLSKRGAARGGPEEPVSGRHTNQL